MAQPFLPLSTLDESSPIRGIPSGQMNDRSQEGTLNESIRDSIMRDLTTIAKKFKYVLFPSGEASPEWDLWGPFILCLILSVVLATQAQENQKGYVFALVYVFVFAGSAVVTINAVLLKGNVSLLQTVSLLGYCILPLAVAAIGCWVANQVLVNPFRIAAKVACVAAGLVWSTKASVGFMAGLVPDDRRVLGVYPVWLLYVSISWIVLVT